MASVDGLASGLDTTSIITSLLQVDAAPQTRLKSNITTAQQKVTALQSVNTKLAALQTAADALGKATGWSPTTTKASSDAVTVSAVATAPAGTVRFDVAQLAAGRSVVDTSTAGRSLTDPNAATDLDLGFPLDVVKDGKIVGTVSPSTGSLNDIVSAINKASNLGITAVAVRVGDDKYRLQITSTTTGGSSAPGVPGKGDFNFIPKTGKAAGSTYDANTDGAFANLAAKFTTVSTAQDAQITIKGNASDLTVSSATNTFADLMPGVTVNVAATTPNDGSKPVTVSATRDPEAVATAMQSLVTAANAVLTEIQNQTKSGTLGTDGKVTGGGPLRGDGLLRSLRSQVKEVMAGALGDGSSAAAFGLESSKDGSTLTLDKTKFLTALAKDPTALQTLVSPTSVDSKSTAKGIVERLQTVVKEATKPFTGTLTTAISSQQTSIEGLQDRVSDWDTRLAAKKSYYQKYYASLESSLSKLKTQSTWLSGQLASLG
ncbi:flagellar filament capping protein FliD [Kineococcus glutinatus]|uniref:Flagellar hook-associated protein 2 n=1 Tax=Kineococcus glutinatus TaxID=1070872 RepID=A0ABP9HXB2_9ACTN